MQKFSSPLRNLKIASPCSEDWNAMIGNDRMRFCGKCEMNVYNLSGMTREEAESLIARSEGRLCVRFYKRADGSVLTRDCPVGFARVKARAKAIVTASASLIFTFFGSIGIVALLASSRKTAEVGTIRPIDTSRRSSNGDFEVMGAIPRRIDKAPARDR